MGSKHLLYLVLNLNFTPLSPCTFWLPQWRQQGSCAMVCFTFCTWTWQIPGTGLAPDPSRAPGFRDIGWCFPGDSVSWERASSLLPLLWPKRARSYHKLILGTQGVTASPYMPLGPWISLWTKPFVQGLLGSAIHGYTSIFISSYSELRNKCVPTEPTKLIFSAPACLVFFLSSLLPYTSYF